MAEHDIDPLRAGVPSAFKRRPERAGPAMRGILARLPVEGNFVLRDLMHSVKGENPNVTDKHIHNAIAHLRRQGSIKNIGYGQYEVSSPRRLTERQIPHQSARSPVTAAVETISSGARSAARNGDTRRPTAHRGRRVPRRRPRP